MQGTTGGEGVVSRLSFDVRACQWTLASVPRVSAVPVERLSFHDNRNQYLFK